VQWHRRQHTCLDGTAAQKKGAVVPFCSAQNEKDGALSLPRPLHPAGALTL